MQMTRSRCSPNHVWLPVLKGAERTDLSTQSPKKEAARYTYGGVTQCLISRLAFDATINSEKQPCTFPPPRLQPGDCSRY
jgi:hypothetical protein